MKIKFPAEAFALAMVVFSRDMREAMVVGILLIFALVFGELLRSALEDQVPGWSLIPSVLLAVTAVTHAGLRMSYAWLGLTYGWEEIFLQAVLGLLTAKHVLKGGLEEDYDGILFESAIAYAFLILIGMSREFLSVGSLFGYHLADFGFMSKSFQKVMFGFILAGMGIAFTNGILKKRILSMETLLITVPVVLVYQPFQVDSFPELASLIISIVVPVILFISVKKRIAFSNTGIYYRKCAVDLLSMGFIYMILSVF